MKKIVFVFFVLALFIISCKSTQKEFKAEVVMNVFHLYVQPQHEYFSYAGDVRNIGWATAYNVIIKLEVFYKDGQPYSTKITLTNPPDIQAQTSAGWRIDYFEANKNDIKAIDFDKTKCEILWD